MTTPTRTDPEKHRDQVRRANRARHRANNELKALHLDEWHKLYAAAAKKEGVTPKPRETPEVAKLRGQIAELTSQLQKRVAGKPPVKKKATAGKSVKR